VHLLDGGHGGHLVELQHDIPRARVEARARVREELLEAHRDGLGDDAHLVPPLNLEKRLGGRRLTAPGDETSPGGAARGTAAAVTPTDRLEESGDVANAGEVRAPELVHRRRRRLLGHLREVLEHAVVDLGLRHRPGRPEALQRVGDDGREGLPVT
jgi:hypothetical protein